MGSDMFDMLMIFRLACLPLSTLTALHERLLTVPQAASQGRNCPQCSHPDVTATPTPNRKPCSVIGPFLSARHVHRASLRSIMTISGMMEGNGYVRRIILEREATKQRLEALRPLTPAMWPGRICCIPEFTPLASHNLGLCKHISSECRYLGTLAHRTHRRNIPVD